MSYFHPEEEFQVWTLYGYERSHPGSHYLIEFADSEFYVCHFDAAYDSENGGELDIEDDNAHYDEFAQTAMQVCEVIDDGLRRYHHSLTLDYRDWPAIIKSLDTGAVVYAAAP